MIFMSLLGGTGLRKTLYEAGVEGPVTARRELRMLGEEIMTASKRLVPVDTGRLRSSGFVRSTNGGSVVEVGYATNYALFVHEIPARHLAPTQYKYLEVPARLAWQNFGSKMSLLGGKVGVPPVGGTPDWGT